MTLCTYYILTASYLKIIVVANLTIDIHPRVLRRQSAFPETEVEIDVRFRNCLAVRPTLGMGLDWINRITTRRAHPHHLVTPLHHFKACVITLLASRATKRSTIITSSLQSSVIIVTRYTALHCNFCFKQDLPFGKVLKRSPTPTHHGTATTDRLAPGTQVTAFMTYATAGNICLFARPAPASLPRHDSDAK